jgi:protein-disulfide isomerase
MSLRLRTFEARMNDTDAGRTSRSTNTMRQHLLVTLAGLLAVGGCQGTGSFAKLQESLAQIDQKQDAILARLDQLEQKAGSAPAPKPRDPKQAQQQQGRPVPTETYKATVDDAHVKGPAQALVTIVEWSDFQCPFCSRVNPTIDQISKEYGDKVRVAFKHNPLPMHNRAMAAAVAAEAAGKQGPDKFWKMHDLLFANAKELTDENFVEWAGEVGLDVEKFKIDLKDAALEKKVKQQQAQGAKLGARGTPAFFVNGRFLSGAQPFEAFKNLIDEELHKAQKLTATGVPPAKVYDKVMEKAKASV